MVPCMYVWVNVCVYIGRKYGPWGNVYVYAREFTCERIYIYIDLHAYTHIQVQFMPKLEKTYSYAREFTYERIYIYIYIYTYIHTHIQVQFMPKLEKTYNYNAVCTVKKKASRLALNIKGEGFDTHSTVTMEDERGAHQVCIYVPRLAYICSRQTHAYIHVTVTMEDERGAHQVCMHACMGVFMFMYFGI